VPLIYHRRCQISAASYSFHSQFIQLDRIHRFLLLLHLHLPLLLSSSSSSLSSFSNTALFEFDRTHFTGESQRVDTLLFECVCMSVREECMYACRNREREEGRRAYKVWMQVCYLKVRLGW
jgi:hypothetical protein